MFRVGETTGNAAQDAALPQTEDLVSAEYIMFCLLAMHAENTREAVTAAEETVSGTLRAHADPLLSTQINKVVACRQNMFLRAMLLLSGISVDAVDHEQALVCLRNAQDSGCAAAMAVLCADYPDDNVKQTCFDVLRDISLSVAAGFYNSVVTVSCKTLCARICELQLVKPPKGYDYLDEYKEASKAGCQVSSVMWGKELERRGQLLEAACLYASAAEGGYAAALYHMARCLRDGIGVEQNSAQAMQIMKQSADKKFTWAMLDCADMLMNAENPTTRVLDDKEAFALLNEVEAIVKHAYVHRGPMRCLYLQFDSVPNPHRLLAKCYEEGRGVAQDLAAAERQEALFKSGQ